MSNRVLTLENEEDESDLQSALRSHVINNGGHLDEDVERWFDSEFNRIYVLYHYTDVTKIN